MSDVLRTATEYCHMLVKDIGTGGATEGTMYFTLGAIGVWLEDYDMGDDGVLIVFGDRVRLPKVEGAGGGIFQSEFVYYNDTSKVVCGYNYAADNAGTYYRVGVATLAAATTDEFVEVDFYGNNWTVLITS